MREPLRQAVKRLPRRRELLVFGCALDRFADNSAYLFLHLSTHEPTLRCVWITGSSELVDRLRRHGLRAERRWSLGGISACLHAGRYVVSSYPSDVNRWFHDGAEYVNLWHGLGVTGAERILRSGSAAFLYKQRGPRSLLARALYDETRRPDWVLSSTRAASERVLSPAFSVDIGQCLEFGYPRNDHLMERLTSRPPSDALLSSRASWERLAQASFVVGYFPTWRKDGAPLIATGGLSLSTLAEIIAARGGLLAFKPHFNTSWHTDQHAAIVALDPDDDANAYLPLCHVLITDYSSVGSDYWLLGRPIVYFLPDHPGFLASHRLRAGPGGRPLGFDLKEVMPDIATTTPTELYEVIKNGTWGINAREREQAVKLIWGGYEGNACKALADFLR